MYACIDAVAEAGDARAAAATALDSAGVGAADVDYVELSADGPGDVDDDEVVGNAAAYARGAGEKAVAVGTVKTAVGNVGYAAAPPR